MSAIDDLATELAKLPGIGRKTALRLTYHLLKQPPEQSQRLARVLAELSDRVHPCAVCFNLTEADPCAICRDPRRDRAVICVVEEASDIGAIERAGEFRGVYHVLGGRLSPLDGIGPEDLTIRQLSDRDPGGRGARGDRRDQSEPRRGGDRAVRPAPASRRLASPSRESRVESRSEGTWSTPTA